MSEKALATGSTCPPLKDGTLRLYSMRFCPFAQRTRLVLAHLNIPHEVVNVNLKEKPEWFFKKNPLALVPVLEKGDDIVYESSICDEYLDEVYGKQSLLTTDPLERARQKIIGERFSKVIAPFYGILRQTGDERVQAVETAQKAFDIFEELLTGKFFGGETPKMIDYHIWPWYERLGMLEQMSGGIVILPKDRFPKLNSWIARMKEVPAVKATSFSTDLHVKFFESHTQKDGKADYDLGLE
jgi:glutathione S-transferase